MFIFSYRLKVSNLNASVSESDLVDLFCAIGAIRDARLTSTPGSAIITFVKRAAAIAAVTKYNGRELDKQKISGIK
jgi:RNA recognition motif-containing protein